MRITTSICNLQPPLRLLAVLVLLIVFSSVSAQPTWRWAVQEGGPYIEDYAPRMVTTASGQLVAFANVQGSNSPVQSFQRHVVLTALDTTGVLQWRHAYTAPPSTRLSCSVIDLKVIPGPAGGFYGLISFSGTLDLGAIGTFVSSSPVYQTRDGLLIRFDSVGQIVWVSQLIGAPNLSSSDRNVDPSSLAIDAASNVWVGGVYRYTLTVGNLTFQSTSRGNGFLVKYSSTGNVISAYPFGGLGLSSVTGLAADNSGGVYVTGVNRGSLAFPVGIGLNVLPPANSDYFVARFTAQVQPQWIRARSNSAPDSTTSDFIALTSDGGYVVAGHMKGSTPFGTQTFASGGSRDTDIFVARYDSLGQVQWAQRAASTENERLNCFVLDAQDNCYLATYAGLAPLTIGPMAAAPSLGAIRNALFARISALGQPDWLVRTAGTANEQGTAIVPDAGRAVYCSGQFEGTLTLGATALTDIGGSDFFIARLDGARPMGLLNEPTASGLALYPNPAGVGTAVRVDLGKTLSSSGTLTLTDALGRLIHRETWVAGARTGIVNTPALSAGVYIVRVAAGQQALAKRLLIRP